MKKSSLLYKKRRLETICDKNLINATESTRSCVKEKQCFKQLLNEKLKAKYTLISYSLLRLCEEKDIVYQTFYISDFQNNSYTLAL